VLASKISSTANVYLMQALDDHEVLPQDSKLFLKNFSCEVSYKEFQTDHSFLGRRQEVYEEIRNFIYA
jgi:surfactin synthase thioesterase subunit